MINLLLFTFITCAHATEVEICIVCILKFNVYLLFMLFKYKTILII